MRRVLLTAVIPTLLPALLSGCASTTAAAPAERPAPTATHTTVAALDEALSGSWRDPKNVTRDVHRHPKQTLGFFGVTPDQTVIEITPGGGWYSEILAPYLRDKGHYVAAVWDDAITGQPKYRYELNQKLRERFAGNAAVYGTPEVRVFDPAKPDFGPAGSADTVLTFRNAHNWVSDGNAAAYFKAFYDVLKPGGTLGVVDHRAKPGTDLEVMKKSGYVTEELVIELAQGAGFVLADRSEINANPKDTADHPNGVWSLPPSNRHDAADDAKYQAIGESDRMTLRFTRPTSAR
ncbi:class I SAM-dependent methyltransferase [Cystobacter ferrugineus]|uniref:Methyltransferase n=1 Tax=Cystobacter ferrugineus TaxID=83449 RepID=A0A1L9BAC6_9BACT|nr:class I SAM-dependent methyltransferase [Cystobacter ferrugineus]OJH39178.1 methyltransferase [Cystobacter ferrugineus]